LVRQACGRIRILAGSGIDVGNVQAILDSGVEEIHASCTATVDNPDPRLVELGFCGPKLRYTDASHVSALTAAMEDWRRRRGVE
jgi:copper homeostasis protein